MASQSILNQGSAYTIALASNASIAIPVAGFLGWGFDLNIVSTAASGNLNVYTQYTNPTGDTNVRAPTITYAVTSGNFGTIGSTSSVTSVAIDSNNVTTKGWIVLKWVGSDTSSGTITVVGLENIF